VANILHIATKDAWEAAKASGFYAITTLKSEGFIHCSKPAQVLRVARERFAGRDDLVLLEIAENRVRVEIKYENCEGGTDLFPHLYGPLNVDAVIGVHEFAPDKNGEFDLPGGLDSA
jgi:uncharacterized protein (DUF952 family)